jgi:uncharacterized NAD-dependent epimerase/dehydratase family protein
MVLDSNDKVVLLQHGGLRGSSGKTGLGYARYGIAPVVAVVDNECVGQDFSILSGLPCHAPIVSSVKDALKYGPTTLLIGIAPPGGVLPEEWFGEVEEAVRNGLSIVNGLHSKLSPTFSDFPLRPGQRIWDVRQEPAQLNIGSAKAASLDAARVLTVGTDMAIGKKSAALELNDAARRAGMRSTFVATGQGGVMITGGGICLDAIRVDFAAGAVENEVVRAASQGNELIFIEGQGSLLHPGSTATLPLLRGAQPTALILVHRYGQESIARVPSIKIPPLLQVARLYEELAYAAGAFGKSPVVGIALNTAHLSESDSRAAIEEVRTVTGLPCDDVVRNTGDWLYGHCFGSGES